MKKLFGLALALLLALSLADGTARAKPEKLTEFDVHVGDAFIHSVFGLPISDVAQASNGDTIKVIFSGHIDVEDREAEGNGTFEHRDSGGTLLESGTFKAKQFMGFTDFGTTAGLPPTFHGGTTLILVRAVGHSASNPEETTKFDATLRVDCGLGNPPAGLEEGINFAISGGLNFDEKPSSHGFTLFVAAAD